MALANATSPVQLSGTHLSSIWIGLRQITAKARLNVPSGELSRQSTTVASAIDKEAGCPSDRAQVGIEDAILELEYSSALRPHWRESHKSCDSFQQNMNGSRPGFDLRTHEVCSAVLGPGQFTFTPRLVNNVLCQQIRGFKTKRSETSGLSGGRTLGKIETTKVPVSSANIESGSFSQSLPSETDKRLGLSKFLSSLNLSPEEEKRIKLSFADGFHAGSDWRGVQDGFNNVKFSPLRTQAFIEGLRCYSAATTMGPRDSTKNRLSSTLIRIFVTAILVFIAYFVLSPDVSVKKVSFLNGDQFEVKPESITITFDDVRGLAEAKSELTNIVDFLKNPSKYTDLGAKLPNGCLLVGPPGVGKTLLAKAVAGEAGVPFFQASGSEFDEVFVGTGAKRIRQLFKAAKEKAPCVVFIDEIDSVGGKRTSSEMHPYANQTVNQLLTEMDGFETNEGVIVLGATNKKANLDVALLRPGRFDVEVSIRVPDLNERKEILALYLPKIVSDGKVDITSIAKCTTGCTGADLNNICNHAAMKAATDGDPVVTMKHIEYAIDKVRMGPQKKRVLSPQVNRYTAYHEAGHAIVRYYSKINTAKLHKITILPRGDSLGMTHFISEEKREFQYTKEEIMDDIDAAMGGRIAEELTFGENKVSTGASSDMKSATNLATWMISNWGFSDKVGLGVHSSNDVMSEKVKEEIDEEIKRVLRESYDRAKKLLITRQKEMNRLAEALLEYEEMTYEEAKIVIEGGSLKRRPNTKLTEWRLTGDRGHLHSNQ
ncbi:ATP-dependent zinc metalloprotease YME1L-like [Watersipora subatra]|uniref:ATP-dependent zinc metalloprotease YME1L-like n=1 Tax=Watersipora subatra TaxID=2589382 RepID=UPI00355BF355